MNPQRYHPPSDHHHTSIPPPPPCASSSSTPLDHDEYWSLQELKDFISIRAHLDRAFLDQYSTNNKNDVLWHVVASMMKDRHYSRTPPQCKSKWNYLIATYKSIGTMHREDAAALQSFPFYKDMNAIFTNRIQQGLWLDHPSTDVVDFDEEVYLDEQLDEDQDEDDINVDYRYDQGEASASTQFNAHEKIPLAPPPPPPQHEHAGKKRRVVVHEKADTAVGHVKSMLEGFMNQQVSIEAAWMESMNVKEEERRRGEREWRQRMEGLERERLVGEMQWREREEQRKAREEVRSEKRHALLTTLLSKLLNTDHQL